jgi:hypothetical protein
MRESRPYGSERGAFSNGRPYRDRTSDLRSAACASPSAAGSCSAASSTPFPRDSLAGGCGFASTRIGSSLPRRNPSPHPAARATRTGPRRPQPSRRRLPPCCHAIHSPARQARRADRTHLSRRALATPHLRPSLGRAHHATAGEESLPHHGTQKPSVLIAFATSSTWAGSSLRISRVGLRRSSRGTYTR